MLGRGQDIKVVMALGDSILAGLAIMGKNTDDIFNEYRGLRCSPDSFLHTHMLAATQYAHNYV